MNIMLIDYGAGNLWSIRNAFKKVGFDVGLAVKPSQLEEADAIVLPGVGNFGDAMKRLVKFKPAIADTVESGTPFLGLCLGIQVLMDSSDESPGAKGLGIFKGSCKRFPAGKLKVPHMGWNTVKMIKDTPLLEGVEEAK
jgi:glutamine amidotransferase